MEHLWLAEKSGTLAIAVMKGTGLFILNLLLGEFCWLIWGCKGWSKLKLCLRAWLFILKLGSSMFWLGLLLKASFWRCRKPLAFAWIFANISRWWRSSELSLSNSRIWLRGSFVGRVFWFWFSSNRGVLFKAPLVGLMPLIAEFCEYPC